MSDILKIFGNNENFKYNNSTSVVGDGAYIPVSTHEIWTTLNNFQEGHIMCGSFSWCFNNSLSFCEHTTNPPIYYIPK